MRPRDLTVMLGILGLGAAAGIAFLGQDTFALTLVPPGPEASQPRDATVDSTPTAVPAIGDVESSDVAAAQASHVRGDQTPSVDTTGWTKGLIRGDITIAVAALEHLQSISVLVEEMRSAIDQDGKVVRPESKVVRVERGLGTPTFQVDDVRFSDHPYRVSVYAPGLNGGSAIVTIDKDHPIADVELTITPGAPYTVFVRDQDNVPHHRIDVRLLPVGAPAGRPKLQGTTDNSGAAVFGSVLAGDYQLYLSNNGQLVTEVKTLTVQGRMPMRAGVVSGQSTNVVVPRGVEVNLVVHDAAGYGVAGAKVTAIATDRVRATELQGEADAHGRVQFPHLQPGSWHLQIEKENFQRVDLQLRLTAGQEPQQKDVRMVRLR